MTGRITFTKDSERGSVGHPVLRVDRLYLDTDGECVELAISHFLPEHYSYRISLLRNG